MRLRSSQFVFLLLLACSAQIHDVYASQLLAQAIDGAMQSQSIAVGAARTDASSIASRLSRPAPRLTRSGSAFNLDPASLASHRVAWTVRRPARDSAAIISFTGFLRA